MPYKIKEKVVGLGDCLRVLDNLKRATRGKILRKALGAAGKLILWKAKSLAPKETGLLRKSLGRKVKVYRESGVGVVIVGPRTGFRQDVVRRKGKWLPTKMVANPVKYAHLQELGTVHRPARPFLRPSITGQQQQIRDAVAMAVNEGLEAESAKGKK